MKKLKSFKLSSPKNIFKKIKKLDWKTFLKFVPLIALFIYLYIYKLSILMPNLSITERLINVPKLGINSIINDPRYLPIKFVKYIFGLTSTSVSVFEIRLASVVFGLLTIFMIYEITRSWLGRRAAVIGTILFSFSAWTLHVSRIGTYSIMYMFSVTLFIYSLNMLKKYYLNKKYFLIITAIIWPLLITVPGMIYFIVYALIKHKKEIKEGLKNIGKLTSLNIFSLIILIGIFVKYLITSPVNILNAFYLPTTIHKLSLFPVNLLKTIYHLFILGPNTPEIWMNKAPVLDLLVLMSALFGMYFYFNHRNKGPAYLLFYTFVIATILTALNNPNDPSLILPMIYLFSATGIALFLQRWLGVFPRNPIAKVLGIGAILLLVSLSTIYNYRSYFVAWPHNQYTKSYFISNS
jgi:hypothetical protein